MSTINTNVAALVAQQGLAASQTSLNTALQRLSTGLADQQQAPTIPRG